MNNTIRAPPILSYILSKYYGGIVMYKSDYSKYCFRQIKDENGDKKYYIKIKKKFIEVPKEVYSLIINSVHTESYRNKRRAAVTIQYYEGVESEAAPFFCNFADEIHTKFLAKQAIKEIMKLPVKYRDIAYCIFVLEYTQSETARILNIPYSTVHDRKIKAMKILQKKIKKNR